MKKNSAILFLFTKTCKNCILLSLWEEKQTDEWWRRRSVMMMMMIIKEWYICRWFWEEVEVCFFSDILTDVSYWHFLYGSKWKKNWQKKINYGIESLCTLRSFLLSSLIFVAFNADYIRREESTVNSTISVSIDSLPLLSCTSAGSTLRKPL